MTNLQITKCTLADLEPLVAISRETFWDTFAPFNSQADMDSFLNQAYTPEKLGKELRNPDSSFYILKSEAEILGYLKLNINGAQSEDLAENSLEVERIYIRSKHLRHGYGQKLLQFAEKEANRKAKRAIWLGVWEHNERAKAFYEKMGFKKVGAHDFYLGSDRQQDWLLLKELD